MRSMKRIKDGLAWREGYESKHHRRIWQHGVVAGNQDSQINQSARRWRNCMIRKSLIMSKVGLRRRLDMRNIDDLLVIHTFNPLYYIEIEKCTFN